MKRNGFSKAAGSTYACGVCGRQTRNTGVQSIGSRTCPQCFDLAGIENELTDTGGRGFDGNDHAAEIVALVAEIESLGGDATSWTTGDEFVGQIWRRATAVASTPAPKLDDATPFEDPRWNDDGRDNGGPVVDDRDTGDHEADPEPLPAPVVEATPADNNATNAEWLTINALRLAADRWRELATIAPSLADQFTGQAISAASLADAIEAGTARVEIGGRL